MQTSFKGRLSGHACLRASVMLMAFLICCTYLQGQVYPAPVGLKPSAQYRVKVNGKDCFVYDSPVPAAYCMMDFTGPLDIEIISARDVKWVDLRPRSSGVQARFTDSIIRLRLTKPMTLSLELNGSLKIPLFIFANPPEKNKPMRNSPGVHYFESGKIHYPGLIEMKSGETVYIEGGAVVVGVIHAKNATNIRIAGRGVLDGSFNIKLNPEIIRTGNLDQIRSDTGGSYHRFIELENCSDVTVEGITLHNSTSWQIVPIQCTQVTIDGVRIISDQASDDGIDVVHSSKVRIRNAFIRTKDDCVVVKSYLTDSTIEGSHDVVVEKCVFWNALWGNALEVGFELNAKEVYDIYFRDCDIIHVEAGAAMSIHNAGKAVVRNVQFSDIRIEDARQKLFDLSIVRSQYSLDGARDAEERKRLYLEGAWDGVLKIPPGQEANHANFRGQIRDIRFRNIQITDGLFPYSVFYGYDARHDIRGVVIENLQVHGKKVTSIPGARLYQENTSGTVLK
jgi:hypothetical protein